MIAMQAGSLDAKNVENSYLSVYAVHMKMTHQCHPLQAPTHIIDSRRYLPLSPHSLIALFQLTQEYIFLYHSFPSTCILFSLFRHQALYPSIDTRICLPLSPLSFHTVQPLSMLGIISFLYRLFPFKLFQCWASYARIYPLLSPLLMPDTVSFN